MTVHGGDVWQVGEELGIPASELLDFSANINPRGLPPRARERLARDASDPRLLSFYPDPSARRLRNALERTTRRSRRSDRRGPWSRGAAGSDSALPAASARAGSGSGLQRIPAGMRARADRIHAVSAGSRGVIPDARGPSLPAYRSGTPGVVLLNNPHNPSGAMLDAARSPAHRRRRDSSGATLLLDEAFIDYVPARQPGPRSRQPGPA